MKKAVHAILILIIAILAVSACLSGCNGNDPLATLKGKEATGAVWFYDASTGKVYNNLSSNFDIKTDVWEIRQEQETGFNQLVFSITVKNKTGKRLDNFCGVVSFDEKTSDIISSGITRYDQYDTCDLIPESSANGVSYGGDLLIEKDAGLNGADINTLLEKLRNITLELSWDGGKETVKIVCDQLKQV